MISSSRRAGMLSGIISLLAGFCSAAHSQQVIFSSMGSGEAYDAASSYCVRGPLAFGEGSTLAVQFTPGPGTYTLSGVEMPLALDDGTNRIDARLLTDVNGLPGSTLDQFSSRGSLSSTPSLITMSSTLDPTLTGGTSYWLALTPTGDTTAKWCLNAAGTQGSLAQSGLGLWSHDTTDTTLPAFRVLGASVTSSAITTATPEPGTLALFAAGGLAGAMTYRRKRSSRKS